MSDEKKNSSRDDDDKARKPLASGADDVGFFHLRKPGQGYWTRLCTALAAAGILLLVANFIYTQAHLRLGETLFNEGHSGRTRDEAAALARNISLAISAALVVGGGLLGWKFMNGPKGTDFLITTDSEMKKVNWASRKELFGSTRVVIIFLVLIACFLFGADIVFGWFFNLIGVLKHGPFNS